MGRAEAPGSYAVLIPDGTGADRLHKDANPPGPATGVHPVRGALGAEPRRGWLSRRDIGKDHRIGVQCLAPLLIPERPSASEDVP